MIKTYVIHYTRNLERKKHVENELRWFPLEFITEYDREDITPEDLAKHYKYDEEIFTNKVKDLWNPNEHRPRRLSDAEISCTMKHIEAIRRIADGPDSYAMVVEDDIVFIDSLNCADYKKRHALNSIFEYIETIISCRPEDGLFANLGLGVDYLWSKKVNFASFLSYSSLVPVTHPATNCAEAMVISRSAAQKIISTILPFQLVSDWEIAYHLYYHNISCYWSATPIFTQGSRSGIFQSELR